MLKERYDNYLLNKAKKEGVEVREEKKVVDLRINKNEIITESGNKIKGDHIVAAGGINSVIRDKLRRKGKIKTKEWSKNLALAFETFVSDRDLERKTHPTLHYGIVDWGYGWIFPNKDQLVVGIGGLIRKNNNLKDLFDKYTSFLDLKPEEVKAYPVPYGNFIRSPSYGKIHLIGDAAGFVNPLTGEGIFYAERSGELSAMAIQNEKEGQILDAGSQYIKSINKQIIPDLTHGKMIRTLLFSQPRKMKLYSFKLFLKFWRERFVKMIHGI